MKKGFVKVVMRTLIGLIVLTGVPITMVMAEPALSALHEIAVYHDPSWGCCIGWGTHLEQNGFKVKMIPINNPGSVRVMYGIPAALSSCHTAKIGDYFIEGHIPANDIKRLIREQPDIKGLIVPGMPGGSPGMESSPYQPYAVLSMDRKGKITVYTRH